MTYIPAQCFIQKEMPLTRVPEGSRDIPHTVRGGLCRAAQAGGSPSALRGALRGAPRGVPTLAGPVGSPGTGALLEQRLPKERRFLESKGLGARAACESCREAEVICWETLRASPEPPFFQGPAQRSVSSWINSSVGQAVLASTEQASTGRCSTASVSGASHRNRVPMQG